MNSVRCKELWGNRRARWYSEALQYSDYADKIVGVMEPMIRGCSSLLDVGAGCGALSIPLARFFDSVVALDSSTAMLEKLRGASVSTGVSNILTEAATWDEVAGRMGLYDVVLCANVPGVLEDLPKSIPRLEQHAKRYLFLVLGTSKNRSKFYFDELWPLIHRTSSPVKKDYFDVYSTLHQMDVFANVVLVNYSFDQPFQDISEAVSFWKNYMELTGREWDKTLQEFLSKKLRAFGGKLWAGVRKQSAVIWWQPRCRA